MGKRGEVRNQGQGVGVSMAEGGRIGRRGRVISPIEGVKVLVRVQGWLGGEAGRVIDIYPQSYHPRLPSTLVGLNHEKKNFFLLKLIC